MNKIFRVDVHEDAVIPNYILKHVNQMTETLAKYIGCNSIYVCDVFGGTQALVAKVGISEDGSCIDVDLRFENNAETMSEKGFERIVSTLPVLSWQYRAMFSPPKIDKSVNVKSPWLYRELVDLFLNTKIQGKSMTHVKAHLLNGHAQSREEHSLYAGNTLVTFLLNRASRDRTDYIFKSGFVGEASSRFVDYKIGFSSAISGRCWPLINTVRTDPVRVDYELNCWSQLLGVVEALRDMCTSNYPIAMYAGSYKTKIGPGVVVFFVDRNAQTAELLGDKTLSPDMSPVVRYSANIKFQMVVPCTSQLWEKRFGSLIHPLDKFEATEVEESDPSVQQWANSHPVMLQLLERGAGRETQLYFEHFLSSIPINLLHCRSTCVVELISTELAHESVLSRVTFKIHYFVDDNGAGLLFSAGNKHGAAYEGYSGAIKGEATKGYRGAIEVDLVLPNLLSNPKLHGVTP